MLLLAVYGINTLLLWLIRGAWKEERGFLKTQESQHPPGGRLDKKRRRGKHQPSTSIASSPSPTPPPFVKQNGSFLRSSPSIPSLFALIRNSAIKTSPLLSFCLFPYFGFRILRRHSETTKMEMAVSRFLPSWVMACSLNTTMCTPFCFDCFYIKIGRHTF